MSQLLGLLNKARYFFLFLFLELICFAIIRKNNLQWDVSLFNSTNAVVGKTMAMTHGAKEYLYLKQENENLANENNSLRKELIAFQEREGRPDNYYMVDSLYAERFAFSVAKVVNSTTALAQNYITINKGNIDGLKAGMGVISPRGVVGQVKSCSDHFCNVYSILHEEFRVSSEVRNEALRGLGQTALGLCTWGGESRGSIDLETVDKFKQVNVGDSVVTSSQNKIFPSGILVGKVKTVQTPTNGAFHIIDVELASDFGGLTYVYVINNSLLEEELSLEREVTNE